MSVIKLTKDSYEKEVQASAKPVLIDFYATWCGPCKMISPIVDEIAVENENIKVCKVDVDSEPELAQAFSVASIPTIVVVKNGKITSQSVGYKPKGEIMKMLG